MNKMTIIQLLNKIANGEEVPKKIKVRGDIFEFYERLENMFNYKQIVNGKYVDNYLCDEFFMDNKEFLNDEVEIIEEENKKCTVETCCIGIEGLSKALLKIKDDMQSIYENIDKVETLEEEKEIPEKLDHLIGYDIRQFDDLKEYVEITTNDLFGKVNKIIDTLNQVIDYLKSKGE